MGRITEAIGDYVRKTGINLAKMSKETGIAYEALYSSLLNKNRKRELRVEEFFTICNFIERDPMEFVDVNDLSRKNQQDQQEAGEYVSLCNELGVNPNKFMKPCMPNKQAQG